MFPSREHLHRAERKPCWRFYDLPRGYRAAKARVPATRTLKDQLLIPELMKIHQENYSVYGVRRMWHVMRRAGWDVGRDQTYWLMKAAGIADAHRGRKPITTRAAKVIDECPDLVNRDFTCLLYTSDAADE